MDGGMHYHTNLVSAIERCRETVDKDEDITIDIVTCHYNPDLHPRWENKNDALDNFLRYRDIKDWYHVIDDIFKFK